MRKKRKKIKKVKKRKRRVVKDKTRRSEKIKKSLIRIKVVGIGGAGGNVVTRMSRDFPIKGVEFIAVNTDLQDLEHTEADRKIHIGKFATKGMGAGMNPELGEQAAEENRAEIVEILKDTDMLFLAAGFGGGTGTGATPIVADIARENNILTVAVITKPFTFEGTQRRQIAEEGVLKLKDKVDTLLIIPNDRIFNIIDNDTPILKAFERIDEILKSAVQGVSEIIASAGLVNVDFADVKTIMTRAGLAVIGVGIASGPERGMKAVTQALNSPLLETSVDNARGVLLGVAGGRDLKMVEINEAAKLITEKADPGAKIIFGAYYDKKLKSGQIKVILIATSFNGLSLRSDIDTFSLFAPERRTGSLLNKRAEPIEEKEESREQGASKKGLIREPLEKSKEVMGGGREVKKSDDFWDVPTFLRRKKR